MASLGRNPNLVTVFDIGEESGPPFIVCELVEGGDLRQTCGGPGRASARAGAIDYPVSVRLPPQRRSSVARLQGLDRVRVRLLDDLLIFEGRR
jgi:serine/threonine protein kinase